MSSSTKPVTDVLEAMKALDDDQLGFLFDVLDAGMHDEWDCTLPNGLGMFGPAEIRIAVKTAAIFANTAESEDK